MKVTEGKLHEGISHRISHLFFFCEVTVSIFQAGPFIARKSSKLRPLLITNLPKWIHRVFY